MEDVTAHRQTGEFAVSRIRPNIERWEAETKGLIVALTTDDGSDVKKARGELKKWRNWLVVLPCAAHQVSAVIFRLVFRAVFRVLTALQVNLTAKLTFSFDGTKGRFLFPQICSADDADHVVKFVRGRREGRVALFEQHLRNGGTEKSILQSFDVRWHSYCICYGRLLIVRPALVTVATRESMQSVDDRLLFRYNVKSKETTEKARLLVLKEGMWQDIKIIVGTIEPLASLSMYLQSDHATLDQLLLGFGSTISHYLKRSRPDWQPVEQLLARNLSSRLKAYPMVLALAAVILHPLYGLAPLADWLRVPLMTFEVVRCAYFELFQQEVPNSERAVFADFRNGTGDFFMVPFTQEMFAREAQATSSEVCTPVSCTPQAQLTPSQFAVLKFYQDAMPPGWISRLALRLFGGVFVNSAGVERSFSSFNLVLDKTSNRMGDDLLRASLSLRNFYRREKAARSPRRSSRRNVTSLVSSTAPAILHPAVATGIFLCPSSSSSTGPSSQSSLSSLLPAASASSALSSLAPASSNIPLASPLSQLPSCGDGQDDEDDMDPEEVLSAIMDRLSLPQPDAPSSSLRRALERFEEAPVDWDEETDAVESRGPTAHAQTARLGLIKKLKDCDVSKILAFDNLYWSTVHEQVGLRQLSEMRQELEALDVIDQA